MAPSVLHTDIASIHRLLAICHRQPPSNYNHVYGPYLPVPNKNNVVQETMVRSVKVAEETHQEYTVVTYDLAVALKAYSIQALQTPLSIESS